jgi:hypothetical protein
MRRTLASLLRVCRISIQQLYQIHFRWVDSLVFIIITINFIYYILYINSKI